MKEADFLRQVRQLARTLGWMTFHHPYSLGADPGFPDLVLVHEKTGRLVVAELKGPKGKLSEAQIRWLDAFRATAAEVYVWRPDDFEEIKTVLYKKQ